MTATEAPTQVPNSEAETHKFTVGDLARDLAELTTQIAKDHRIPIGAAHTIVKTALEFHINSLALAQQRPNLPFPIPTPADESTDEEEK